jgi:hypothetical protein
MPFVDGVPFALEVGTEFSSSPGAFVPVQAQPLKSVVNHLNRIGTFPSLIRIFNPQNKRSAAMSGEQPIE